MTLKNKHHDLPCVLMISGDSSIRHLISTFLKAMPCRCVVVESLGEFAALHLEDFEAVLVDVSDSWASAEHAIMRIKELRPRLAERILAFSGGVTEPEVAGVSERYRLHSSRATLLPRIWAALQEFLTLSPPARLAPRRIHVAELILDSFLLPLPAGIRSSGPSGRQLAYRHEDTIIDLLIAPSTDPARVSLAGQVLCIGMKKRKNSGLVVLLLDSMKTITRTTTNQFGEFHLEFSIVENGSLQIRFDEGSWAATQLGNMNWVTKGCLSSLWLSNAS